MRGILTILGRGAQVTRRDDSTLGMVAVGAVAVNIEIKAHDQSYRQMQDELIELIDRMAENRAATDALIIKQNEQETGVGQTPRDKAHWRDVIKKELPFL